MIEGVGRHGLHNGDVVRDFRKMRERFRKFSGALALSGKLELGREQRRVWFDEGIFLAHYHLVRHGFAVVLGERRLVIEQIELARRAAHEEVNDPLGLRRELRSLRRKRVQGGGRRPTAFPEQLAQCDGAETDTALLEKPAAGYEFRVLTMIEIGLAVHNVVK